jgi:arylsulfatase A-like enzyme
MALINKSLPSKPNIVLVMADDQGWGDVGYNGHPAIKTPCLDEMAKTGLRFDRFYAAAPVCSPTRGSILTGRHPNRYGVFTFGRPIRPQEKTVAEALKTAGYVTGHFGKWHLGNVFAGSQVNPGAKGFDEWFSAPNFFDNDPILSREGTAVQTKGESSMVTADAAIDFIRKHSKTAQPFFSVVWFGSPHKPLIASAPDKAVYAGLDEDKQNYYGEITGIDRAVGKLRKELRTLGIEKNTILWFCSDNGGVSGISATGGRGGKGQIYEGGLRVPAILEWPDRIPKNRITNVPAFTTDIFPTLFEIANIKIPEQPVLDGISLMRLIVNKMISREKPMGFWQFPGGGKMESSKGIMTDLLNRQKSGEKNVDASKLDADAGKFTAKYPQGQFPGHAAWLDWPYKLHRKQDKAGNIILELYNIESDPMEANDLAEKDMAKVKSLRPQLEIWQASVLKSLNGGDYPSL